MSEEVRVFRPIIYVIGVIYTIFIVVLVAFMSGGNQGFYDTIGVGAHPDFMVLWAPLIILSALIMLIPRRLGLTAQEMTLIYSMATFGATIPTIWGSISSIGMVGGFAAWWPKYVPVLKLVVSNPLFSPQNYEVFKGFWHGGVAVPWSEWTVPVAWWSTFFIVQYLLLLVAGTLLRRLYLDWAAMPFPTAAGEASVIETVTKPEARRLRSKWMGLGFAVGLISTVGFWLEPVLPWLGIESFSLQIDLTPLALLPWVPLLLNFNTMYVAMGYLVPTDILLSIIVFFVVMYIFIPPIATASGIFPPFEAGMNAGDVWSWNLNMGFNVGGPGWINWGQYSWGYSSMVMGGLIGYVVWLVFRLRSQIWTGMLGFLKAFKTGKSDPDEVPARWLGISFIALLIIYAVLLSYGTRWYIPLWFSIFWALVIVAFNGMVSSAVRAYYVDDYGSWLTGGGMMQHRWMWAVQFGERLFGLGIRQPLPPKPELLPNWISTAEYSILYRFDGMEGHAWPMISGRALEMYKLGGLTGASVRRLFLAMVTSIVLSVLVAIPTWLTFCYAYGVREGWLGSGVAGPTETPLTWAVNFALTWSGWGRPNPQWNLAEGPPWTLWLWYLFGALIVIMLSVIRRFFPRFPIHPIGIAAGIMGDAGVFIPWFLALILKYVTLKIGGTRLYENKGLPIASGLLCGWAVMLVIASILTTLTYMGVYGV